MFRGLDDEKNEKNCKKIAKGDLMCEVQGDLMCTIEDFIGT